MPRCVQAGQFIGARSDFVPEATCAWLRKLQDEVPPMSPPEVTDIIQAELAGPTLEDVFDWIDLDKPLGSASIAQVHKARLRQYKKRPSTLRRILVTPLHSMQNLLGAQTGIPICAAVAVPLARLFVCSRGR